MSVREMLWLAADALALVVLFSVIGAILGRLDEVRAGRRQLGTLGERSGVGLATPDTDGGD